MMHRILAILYMAALIAAPVFGSTRDGAAKRVMQEYGNRLLSGEFEVGEAFGGLYIKENVSVGKQNLWLNIIPGLTRFDRKEKEYLSEFYYEIHYVNNSVPDIRRKSHLTTFERGDGEMERVLYYMTPDVLQERLFRGQYLSPVYPTNYKFYRYTIDSTYIAEDGSVKVLFEEKFNNIKLFTRGWAVIDSCSTLRSLSLEGWDEQCRFVYECSMGNAGIERYMVKDVALDIFYDFALNRLDISVSAFFDYSSLSDTLNRIESASKYNVTDLLNTDWTDCGDAECRELLSWHRVLPLSAADSALYINKGVIMDGGGNAPEGKATAPEGDDSRVLRWLWNLGDGMVSSHHLDVGGSDIKVYPIINPSYLRYSTGKGVTYRLAFNLRSPKSAKRPFYMKPMLGYGFKRKEFYWGISGHYVFEPKNRGMLCFNASRKNSIYRDVEVEKIKDLDFSQIRFSEMSFAYYRDTRYSLDFQRELFNGFDFKLGSVFYYRSLSGNAVGQIVDGEVLPSKYKNFAVNMLLSFQPGMYHYYDGNRKVNLGSRRPRYSLNVEQGVRGPFESKSVYTRAEFDVQKMWPLSAHSALYTRAGFGGYLYDKDTYFISYAFLKENIMALDDDDELSGVFQLLDSEWYNSATRYFRANAAYTSSFLVMNRVLPRVNIFKNEMLFFNMLFMPKLSPYTEIGYGVQTPYIDLGVFAGFEELQFHKIGCKITISLFEE